MTAKVVALKRGCACKGGGGGGVGGAGVGSGFISRGGRGTSPGGALLNKVEGGGSGTIQSCAGINGGIGGGVGGGGIWTGGGSSINFFSGPMWVFLTIKIQRNCTKVVLIGNIGRA